MKLALIVLGWVFLGAVFSGDAKAEAEDRLALGQAINKLVSQVRKDKLYDDWTTLSCLSFSAEQETGQFFDIAVYEKHGSGCPGDPLTAPIVDRFRINRVTGQIEWFDWNFELRSYQEVVKARRQNKGSG